MRIFSKNALKVLAYWIIEREKIRLQKRAKKPKPWTRDPLLRDFRWCNVRRMDDKVSVWLEENWYSRSYTSNITALTAAVLARMINWPDSLSAITRGKFFTGFEYRVALERLQRHKASGAKVFTGAYIINGAAGGDKIVQVLKTVERVHRMKAHIVNTRSMRETWGNILKWQFPGIGSFIAGQVVADLRWVLRGEWGDRYDWAPIGPGSRRGMRRMLGLPAQGPMLQAQFDELLPQLWNELMKNADASDVFDSRFCEAMDLQNCLCEFDKYMRLTNKEGSVRSGYPGQAELF